MPAATTTRRKQPAPSGAAVEATAFGPGKVILLGEHAVVYGHPAVAGPLSWGVTARATPGGRCRLKLPEGIDPKKGKALQVAFAKAAKATGAPKVELSVESDLPLSMGLGSSGALSVACAKALWAAAGKNPKLSDVLEVAALMESEFHGTPSGVDHTTSARGELLYYRRAPGAKVGFSRPLRSPRPLKVLVALVGERSSTRTTVSDLRARRERWPKRYQRLFEEIGRLADEGAKAIEQGDLESLGDAMNVNQGLLSALGLSSPGIEQMVHSLRHAGALGAKLTGAGGDGGAVIALFREPEPAVARFSAEGISCFTSQIAGPRAL